MNGQRLRDPLPGTVHPAARGVCTCSGFTIVEIALCLAIIGFAIIAIISALPTGLNVQKDNREETIINEDAAVWLDALRNGARGYDDLTNYVKGITNFWAQYDDSGNLVKGPNSPGYRPDGYEYGGSDVTSIGPPPFVPLTNGYRIVGLLSTPKYMALSGGGFQSNYVVAYVRAMSGSAIDKAPQDNATVLDAAFTYRMIVDMEPYVSFDTNAIRSTIISPNKPYNPNVTFDPALSDIGALTNSEPPLFTPEQRRAYWDDVRANRRILGHEYANSRDIRLTFRWPVLPTGETGNGRHSFRLFTTGRTVATIDPVTTNQPLFFLEPPIVESLRMR